MRSTGLVAVAFVALLVALACGGGDGGDATPTPNPEQERAAGALLRLDDLPDGWSEVEPPALDPELPVTCGRFAGRESLADGAVFVRSPLFRGPLGEEVRSMANVFESEDEAVEVFRTFTAQLQQCWRPVTDGIRQAIDASEDDAPLADLAGVPGGGSSFEVLTFPKHGDDSLKLIYTVEFDTLDEPTDVVLDVVFIRVGAVAGAVSYLSAGGPPGTSEEERLVAALEERLGELDAQP